MVSLQGDLCSKVQRLPVSEGATSDDVVHARYQSIAAFCNFTFELIAAKAGAVLVNIAKLKYPKCWILISQSKTFILFGGIIIIDIGTIMLIDEYVSIFLDLQIQGALVDPFADSDRPTSPIGESQAEAKLMEWATNAVKG